MRFDTKFMFPWLRESNVMMGFASYTRIWRSACVLECPIVSKLTPVSTASSDESEEELENAMEMETSDESEVSDASVEDESNSGTG